jgi:hypothetical protein
MVLLHLPEQPKEAQTLRELRIYMHTLNDNIGIQDRETRTWPVGHKVVLVLCIHEILDEMFVLIYHPTCNRGTLWAKHLHSSQLCRKPR